MLKWKYKEEELYNLRLQYHTQIMDKIHDWNKKK